MYLVSVVVRIAWSLTFGLVFFAVGLVLFLVLDILLPDSDKGYRVLNATYKYGSLGAFKGLRIEKDLYDIDVQKRRQPYK